ncbi:LacI family transcriptional regulator [Nocardioides mangrovicus]|uniref:LacI family transcriptional regulator n=1 Tax=Nocardioides mangrovicus TaxID=2478913 RepID=A0A3L8NZF0_9ACTN|nr:LacI family transcriptional regulator [Nocardioides mangrovicus]
MHARDRRRPTIRDVAVEAGVSRATVSRVLNGASRVSPSALSAVNRAIERTGYSANLHARALSAGRSHSVAFLLTEPQDRLFEDPNFSTLLRELSRALAQQPVPPVLVLVVASTQPDRRTMLDYLSQQVDGVFAVSTHRGDPLVGELLRAEVPMVACGRVLGQSLPAPSVAADDLEGARVATQHLLDSDRSRIAMISGPMDTSGGTDRLGGYRSVLGDRFDPRLVAAGDYSYASGAGAMRALLEEEPGIDAVFAASDLMASGALAVLRASGRAVPEDVAIVGFDDSSYASASDPPLTTIRQPWDRIAEEMVRLLLALIEGREPVSVTVPTRLVVRESG